MKKAREIDKRLCFVKLLTRQSLEVNISQTHSKGSWRDLRDVRSTMTSMVSLSSISNDAGVSVSAIRAPSYKKLHKSQAPTSQRLHTRVETQHEHTECYQYLSQL